MMFTFGEPIPAVVEELKKFYEKLPGIEICAVVSVEGLPISHYPEELPGTADSTRVAAMTASILSLGERAMLEVGYQELDRILVEGPQGNLITISAGSKAVLTVSAKKTLKIGLLFYDMKRCAEEIAKILDNPEE
ncbi:MAG: roadblock/LC7 domain-containing protein [Candidatus Hodarchaeales archaeon]|jgi:predicted regulator of Ras-like GTPase activity (Roadblock/LC7/MglB family)